jgi:hypothetical protein
MTWCPQDCATEAKLTKRVAELEAALGAALTALCAWQSYMEATSDGMSRPSRETASRLYDQCSDAIAACDRLGIKPNLSTGPED